MTLDAALDYAAARFPPPWHPHDGGAILCDLANLSGLPQERLCTAAIRAGYWANHPANLMARPIPKPADPELAELLEALR